MNQIFKLLPNEKYAICGNNLECGDPYSDILNKQVRTYEIANQIVGSLMLVENLFQTGILYGEFVCKPQAWSLIVTDWAFEITCIVDILSTLIFTFIRYLCSHKGSCNCSDECECKYPCTWCGCVLRVVAWFAIIAALVAIVLLSISISRQEKSCVLMRSIKATIRSSKTRQRF